MAIKSLVNKYVELLHHASSSDVRALTKSTRPDDKAELASIVEDVKYADQLANVLWLWSDSARGVLLIDEVLGVGDPNFKEKSKEKILSMVKGASTVVIVSHSFGLMTDICDRVILLHHGEVMHDGPPQESIKKYYEIAGE